MPQSLIKAMLADAPTALWTFDEPQGATLARDLTAGARHLTYLGSPPMRAAQAIEGDEMRVWSPALGGGDYGQINQSAFANPGSGDFLFTCWLRGTTFSTTNNSFPTLFNLDLNDSGNGIDIYTVATYSGLETGTIRVWYAGAVLQSTLAQQGSSLFDGRAHLIWVEKRSGTVAIYYDGVLCLSAARGTPNIGGSAWTHIGSSYASGELFRNTNPISYVGIWANTTIPAVSRQTTYMAEARRGGVVT